MKTIIVATAVAVAAGLCPARPIGAAQAPQAVAVQAADELDGYYTVTGANPDGKTYEGTATVAKLEHTYSIQWHFDGELGAVGVGIRKGDALAVIFQTKAGQIGVSLYIVTKDRLEGTWGAPGADAVAMETLMKTTEPPAPRGGRRL